MSRFLRRAAELAHCWWGKILMCKYRMALKRIGKGTKIGFRFTHCGGDRIEIGKNVYIGHDVEIEAEGEKVIIGDDTMIAQNVFITTNQHGMADNGVVMRQQSNTHKEVVIGPDVWIGAKVVVLPGVRIGKGAVIGAGAVVTKDIPQKAVAVGVPARVLKYRNGQDKHSLHKGT